MRKDIKRLEVKQTSYLETVLVLLTLGLLIGYGVALLEVINKGLVSL